MRYQFLSHHLHSDLTRWPGAPDPRVEQKAFVGRGDPCNEWDIILRNHTGTHYDAPNHHLENGYKITELPQEYFIFEKPFILDFDLEDSQKITENHLKLYSESIAQCDLLLIHTGYSRYRSKDPLRYSTKSPAVSSQAAKYLVENFPDLRAIMLDFISLGTFNDPEDGFKAHRWLLGKWTEHFICIIEDAVLDHIENENLSKVFALPLMVEEVDSAPVTVLAECY